jgi:hypothetical protein
MQLGSYTLEVNFAHAWGSTQNPDYAAAIILTLADGEYMIAGKGVTISFSSAASSQAGGTMATGLASVEEGAFAAGHWVPGRRLNGDEIMSGKGLRLPADHYTVQKVKLYQYR